MTQAEYEALPVLEHIHVTYDHLEGCYGGQTDPPEIQDQTKSLVGSCKQCFNRAAWALALWEKAPDPNQPLPKLPAEALTKLGIIRQRLTGEFHPKKQEVIDDYLPVVAEVYQLSAEELRRHVEATRRAIMTMTTQSCPTLADLTDWPIITKRYRDHLANPCPYCDRFLKPIIAVKRWYLSPEVRIERYRKLAEAAEHELANQQERTLRRKDHPWPTLEEALAHPARFRGFPQATFREDGEAALVALAYNVGMTPEDFEDDMDRSVNEHLATETDQCLSVDEQFSFPYVLEARLIHALGCGHCAEQAIKNSPIP